MLHVNDSSQTKRQSCWIIYTVVILFCAMIPPVPLAFSSTLESMTNLQRAKVYLAAGDFRLALKACTKEVEEAPSVESYVFLTYIYHALDGYLEALSTEDKWVQVEHLYLNLAGRGVNDLVDPPEVLARIAKEIIQGGARRQADVTAALASRLNRERVNQLWVQQTKWRKLRPHDWWFGVPEGWKW